MRLATLCLTAAALAVGSVGIANANLIKNGDFSNVSGDSSQRGNAGKYGSANPVTVDNWTFYGQAIWYPDAAHATTDGDGPGQLWAIDPLPGGGAFMGLNGSSVASLRAMGEQGVRGFDYGQDYQISFDWAAAQQRSANGKPVTGDTTEQLRVNIFGQYFWTDELSNPSESFTGWKHESFKFTANSTATGFLDFLSMGSPSGLPPMALLANVSVTKVAEPSGLALFGLGVLGLGGMVVVARRRATRRDGDFDGNAI